MAQALLASSFIPGFSGFSPPFIRNQAYVDGGPSNNVPVLDHRTITVTPYAGNNDICPGDNNLFAEDINENELMHRIIGRKVKSRHVSPHFLLHWTGEE